MIDVDTFAAGAAGPARPDPHGSRGGLGRRARHGARRRGIRDPGQRGVRDPARDAGVAVDEVTVAAQRLLEGLVTNAPPKDREVEAAKARARSAVRFGR